MTQDIAIKVENVSKVYKLYNQNSDRLKEALHWRGKKYHHDHFALNNINLEVKKGETVGIIGKNGSGKSTLLKIITGVLTPTSGQVTVNGKISALLELGAGFNPAYTGIENVYLQCQLKGYTIQEIDAKLPEILSFADIGEFVHQPVKTYSSGMFVRLAFAVQACVEPDIFIVDEALAVGDIFFRQKCYQYFERLRANGTSIILVTHGMMDVEQFCQNALLLEHGNTLFFGNASQAVKHYYITAQKDREAAFSAVALSNHQDTKEENAIQAITPLEKKEAFWPNPESFLDISAIPQIGNGWARCVGVALCNENREPCFGFKQGETAHFFYAFELLQDIEVPMAGLHLKNIQGIIVHGKTTLQYNTEIPMYVKKGTVLRFHHQIQLNLAWGEYTFEVGFAGLNQIHYQKRMSYSHEEQNSSIVSLCNLTNVHYLQIGRMAPNKYTELLHHGLTDLPGNIHLLE
jgi:lipopolysaccharide transport system ATP-binding protein